MLHKHTLTRLGRFVVAEGRSAWIHHASHRKAYPAYITSG